MDLEKFGQIERRQMERSMRVLRPACLEIDGAASVALMRDISRSGAGFEGAGRFVVGQEIRYRWGDNGYRSAKVIWVDGSRFGVANDQLCDEADLVPAKYRSVRVPISAPASLFVNGDRVEGEVINFAQRGVCILACSPVGQGALATIKIGRRFLENVTSKWIDGDRVGFALAEPLPVREMAAIAQGR